jgi:hypothetical protein
MSDPPSYAQEQRQRPPPYRASHAFANSQEELAALKEFVESKKYINPSTDGTLPDIANGFGVRAMAWGGMSDCRQNEMKEMKETRRREKEEKREERLVRKMSRQEEKVQRRLTSEAEERQRAEREDREKRVKEMEGEEKIGRADYGGAMEKEEGFKGKMKNALRRFRGNEDKGCRATVII